MKKTSLKNRASSKDDFWRSQTAGRVIGQEFTKHMVGLHLILSVDRKPTQVVYTGFILYYRRKPMWVTAGHVVDEIGEIVANARTKVVKATWLDWSGVPGADNTPAVDLMNLPRFSASRFGIDFGVISLEAAAMMFSGNPRLKWLTEKAWAPTRGVHEGYYLVGMPDKWQQLDVDENNPKYYNMQIQIEVACIPVIRIKRRKSVAKGDFWNHPKSIYGELVPVVSNEGRPLDHPGGMSGGPIFEICRMPTGVRRFRLVGIQAGCSETSPNIIRAESMRTVLGVMQDRKPKKSARTRKNRR